MMEEVEASLKRLQTDYIDLYQAHRDDELTSLDETLAAFDDLVRQGKVRYIGASNYSPARLRNALQVSERYGYARYESMQPPYSLANRGAYEGDLEALCVKEEVGVITYSSLASGFLSGKYRPKGQTPATPRAKGILDRYANEHGFRILEQLDVVAAAQYATVAQVALAWIMARPGITSAIASATTVEQLHELQGAVELKLSGEAMASLTTVSA
jgi:aryl-alcohol dehydrogenase-like predicted oxidoreductase